MSFNGFLIISRIFFSSIFPKQKKSDAKLSKFNKAKQTEIEHSKGPLAKEL